MRKLALAVLFVSAIAGGIIGCGSSPSRKLTPDGGGGSTAGASGSAGATGTAGGGAAGTGTAGDTGTAGAAGTTAGAAGADAAAGAGGTAGADAAAGTGGEAGTAPPIPPYCDTHAKKPLPYNIGGDFGSLQVLLHGAETWKVVTNPNCDQTVFPPLNPTDGGTDGGSDGGTDASDDTLTLQLNDDAATDAPATDGSATDGAVTDGKTDSGEVATNPIPKCFEFTYNPDPCVAANGGVPANAVGACYAGVIFEPNGNTMGLNEQGICIGDGAIQVTFEARANVAGQIIKFGSIREGMMSTEFYKVLTTSWATYSTAIPVGEPYNMSSALGGVWNGFSVVGEPQQNIGGSYILIRNITWSM
jgi:hypothetical protein